MEEIIQILIFVSAMVIAVIGQNAKNKKKPTTPSPQEVLEDMFPDIELTKSSEETTVPFQKSVPKRQKSKVKTETRPQAKQSSTVVSSSNNEKKINLHTRNEAKRAFIYSEIFNRKY